VLDFIIGFMVGASLGCIAGFVLCSWLTAGRIQDEARYEALQEYRDLVKAIDIENE